MENTHPKSYSIIVQSNQTSISLNIHHLYDSTPAIKTQIITDLIQKLSSDQQCSSLSWRWANSLTPEDLQLIIANILSEQTQCLQLNGCLSINTELMVRVFERLKNLKILSFYYSGDEQWDTQFYHQGFSAKHFRERIKWSSKVIINQTNIHDIASKIPKSLLKLSLKNISLSQTKNPLTLFLSNCPNLHTLDLSNTLINDDHLFALDPTVASDFIKRAQELKMNRNRISQRGIFKMFGIEDTEKPLQSCKTMQNLQVLSINDTNAEHFYEVVATMFPKLKKLKINALNISQEQIGSLHTKKNFIWSDLQAISLNDHVMALQDLNTLIKSMPELQLLSLSNIEIEGQHKGQELLKQFPKKLNKVNLNSMHFDQTNFFVFNLINSCQLVTVLKLSNTNISCKLLQRIAQMKNSQTIEHLEISFLEGLCIEALPKYAEFENPQKPMQQSCDRTIEYLLQKIIDNLASLKSLQGYRLFLNSGYLNKEKKMDLSHQEGKQGRQVRTCLDQDGFFYWGCSH